MKRFGFLKLLGIGATVAIVAPALPPSIVDAPPIAAIPTPELYREGEILMTYGRIDVRGAFAAQSKVLQRVYARSMEGPVDDRGMPTANFGTVFENVKYRDG